MLDGCKGVRLNAGGKRPDRLLSAVRNARDVGGLAAASDSVPFSARESRSMRIDSGGI